MCTSASISFSLDVSSNNTKITDDKISVYNFSGINITPGEISMLNLGPKMVPNTTISFEEKKIDILKFSRKLLLHERFYNVNFENTDLIHPNSVYIPKTTTNPVLKSCIEDLEVYANELSDSSKKVDIKDNLTSEQRNAINVFKRRHNVLFFKADKGSGICLLNPEFYKLKVMEILQTDKYEVLHRNVDYFIMLKLQTFVKKFPFLSNSEKRGITNFDFKSTNIYALPKIHKSKLVLDAIKSAKGGYLFLTNPTDLDLRVIFGGPKNPCSGLANLVDILLKPFVNKVQSRVRDVFDFINRIPVFDPEDLPFIEVISVDVKQMYPNLQKEVGLPAIKYFIKQYKDLLPSRFTVDFVLEAMEFVLDNNTGYFDGVFYKQTTGTSTGIKPAPTYADLAMGFLEIKLFYKIRKELGSNVAYYFWKFYRRYLDDGFIFWDTRLGNFQNIFKILDSLHHSITFTMERSYDRLKYLDVIVYKTPSGFKTMVSSKDTDSGTYLPFTSAHPRKCKTNIPFNMARRIRALTDDDQIASEKMQQLSAKLREGKYPQGVVNSAVQQAMGMSVSELRKYNPKKDSDNIITFVHTYDPEYPDLFYDVLRIFSRLSTSAISKPIFGNTRIIDSRREPLNLLRMFQHSRFDDLRSAALIRGVTKCGMPNCKLCLEIMEVSSVSFESSGKHFTIKSKMDCTVRNVVYALFCKRCNKSYVGETVNLRNRATSHRNNSKDIDRAVMKVSQHILRCGEGFKICPILKVSEECKITRLVKEDNLIKSLKPDLNADKRNLLHLNLI